MSANIDRQKLTPPQLAKRWGVAPTKVVGFIRSGELRAMNLAKSRSGRPRYAIDVADIEDFERARQVVPQSVSGTTRQLRRRAAGAVKEFF
jgi:hypothetical protein